MQLSIFAQQNYVHYTVKDGLPQMQCMSLFQDSKGFLWIATKGGVSKYNGINFKNYTQENGLPSNYVFNITEDSYGKIWVFTRHGVAVLEKNKFIYFPSKNKFTFESAASTFIIDKQNKIWFFESKNQQLIRFFKGVYTTFFSAKENNLLKINNLSYDKENNQIYFNGFLNASKTAYFSLDSKSLALKKHETPFVNINHKEKIAIRSKQISKNKSISELYQFTKKDTIRLFQSITGFKNTKRFNDSTIVFTEGLTTQKMPLHYLVNGKLQENTKYYNQINDILQDNEKNTWIASEKGLYKLTPFSNYSEKDNMPDYVWAIQEDSKNKIWFSAYANNYLYYKEKNEIKKYSKKIEGAGLFLGALKTVNNTLIFSHRNGLVYFNGQDFNTKKLPKNAVSFSLFEDVETLQIYVGTNEGLLTIKDDKQSLNKKFSRSKMGTILQMAKNKKGEIWYVTKDNFGKIATESTIKNNQIIGATSLLFDTNDNLWIGAENGLFFYDYIKITRVEHPELTTMISSVIATDNTHFVYGGLRGIGILDINKFYKQYKNSSKNTRLLTTSFVNYYTQSHGFLGEEIAQNGIFKDRKGAIWVPTNSNVVQFHPKDLKTNTQPPFTHITSFKSSSNHINWHFLKDTNPQLKYNQKNIRFDFIGISHTAPDMVTYKFRLKGYADLWRNETKERYVTFTNLPPGEYAFELLASNNNGVWNQKPVVKKFTIVAAFWQTSWFQFVSVLLFAYLLYVLIHYFYLRKRKKIELENELNRLQQQSIQSQLYPHLLFNAVSATGSVIYKENKEKAYDFVVKLSKFMRNALKDSQKLYKTIDEEMAFVESYLQIQKIRFSERFDYQITIDKNVDTLFKIPQMLIQTYVENAVKHGLEPLKKGGLLQISISEEKNRIQISIEDNGIGIEKAKKSTLKGTGSGLRIMNEIYKLHNMKGESTISYTLIDLYTLGKKGTRSVVEIKTKKG